MSIYSKPMPLAWQHKPAFKPADIDCAAPQTLGGNETDAELVYGRAVQLGRFRFGWSVKQCDFLKTETEQWTGAACLTLGESIVGVRESCLWELLPLDQAAQCRFRLQQIEVLNRQAGLSPALHHSLALMRTREARQQTEYEQLALAVQHVIKAKEREINNPWFIDVLQTQAASRLSLETLRSGLLLLAHILADSPIERPDYSVMDGPVDNPLDSNIHSPDDSPSNSS